MAHVTFLIQSILAAGTTSQALHKPPVSVSHTCPAARGRGLVTERALGLQQGRSLGMAQEAASSNPERAVSTSSRQLYFQGLRAVLSKTSAGKQMFR